MLTKTVQQLKGAQAERLLPTVSETALVIDLPLPAYVPTDWLPDLNLRLQIYRRIGGLDTLESVRAMRLELRDRFGELPAAVEGLLYQIEVKLLAQMAQATAILARAGRVEIRLPYLPETNRDLLQLYLGAGVRVTRTAVEITREDGRWQDRLLHLLGKLADRIAVQVGV
jgi:transcription-repair coupling factor (superfamily II helicase)